MAKSGQRKGGFGAGGVRPDRSTKKDVILYGSESIGAIPDPSLRKEVQSAISRYVSIFGSLPERQIKVADFTVALAPGPMQNTLALQFQGGKRSLNIRGIFLNKAVWKNNKETTRIVKELMDDGILSKTPRPVRHAIIHELAHARWQEFNASRKARRARPEMTKVFRQFKLQRREGWGSLARQDVGEFFAEAMAKHASGAPDRYTKKVMRIVEKHNL
jgi:hypothetical protein